MSITRCRTVIGSLYGLMRNALGLNVATPLGSQELSCTVAPDRRLVVLGHDPIAGFARDHGTVANEAAMLALHTLDSTTLLAEPTFVAPGDSCLRADDPGWRWHCIAGHGTTLADWERRPLTGALAGLAVSGHTHAISAVTGLQTALDGKQATLTNATALARITADAGSAPKWDGAAWPGGGSGGSGTVTSVSVVSANGVSGSVANPSTTPAITLSLGAITPTSVAASGAVTGSNLSGTNTGDQTSVTGNAGTATKLATARTINGVSFDGSANITIPAAAGTLTGTTLASGVTASSLTSAAGGNFGTAAFTAASAYDPAGAAAAVTLSGLGGVPTTRTVNGHSLTGNVTVTPSDLSLVVGTNTQAWSAKLDSVSALSTGTGWLHNDGAGALAWSTPSKSDVGLGSVENAALSTWAGSPNLATVGTITAGTWHGTAIADTYIASAAAWNAKVSFPGFGTTGSTAAVGNDSRLSDARTPTAHNQAWSTITTTPTTLSGYGITDAQGLDSDLTALAGLSTTGLIARTGSGTAAVRTITGTAGQVTVTNGDGVAGNPTLSLPQSISVASYPAFHGLYLDDAAGSSRVIRFKTSSLYRWTLGADPGAESGSNAGTNFVINRYSDDGSYAGTVLKIMRLSGNVGIGQAVPRAQLDVAGNCIVSSTELTGDAISIGKYSSGNTRFACINLTADDTYTGFGLRLIRNNTGPNTDSMLVHRGTGSLYIRTEEAGSIKLSTSGSDRMTINPTGGLRFNAYGAGTLVTDSSGNVTASSDRRLKEVGAKFTRGLDDVVKIQPRFYTWKPESGMNTEDVNVGFIAQDVQGAIPEAVGSMKTVDTEEDDGTGKKVKKSKREASEFLTLSDRPIIATLVNAVKELKAENDDLRARVSALENRKAAK